MRIGHVAQMVPDTLAILPGVQQAVGAATIVVHTTGLVVMVAERFFDGIRRYSLNDEFQFNKGIRDAFQISGKIKAQSQDADSKQAGLYYKEMCVKTETAAAKLADAHIAVKRDNKAIANHLRLIGIGILRMIPIVGTCLSIYRFVKLRKEFLNTEAAEARAKQAQDNQVPTKQRTSETTQKSTNNRTRSSVATESTTETNQSEDDVSRISEVSDDEQEVTQTTQTTQSSNTQTKKAKTD